MRGGLRVQLLTDFPARLRRRRQLFLGEEQRPVHVVEMRIQAQSAIVRLEEVATPEAAREQLGAFLYVAAADAVKPPRGQHFVHEVLGLRVVTAAGEALGTVEDVLRTGANDVYVVRGPRGEVLVPAIADVVKRIDAHAGTMTITPLPGMMPGEA